MNMLDNIRAKRTKLTRTEVTTTEALSTDITNITLRMSRVYFFSSKGSEAVS